VVLVSGVLLPLLLAVVVVVAVVVAEVEVEVEVVAEVDEAVLVVVGAPLSLVSSSSGLDSFLCFMRLFWNQILICLSVSDK